MTEKEISKLVAVIAAAYPAARGDAGTVAIYQRMLADLDFVAARAAVERLLATSKWLPTIAEIREATLAVTAGEARPGGAAWGDVKAAIRRYGYDRRPGVDFYFADPVVLEAVRALGWFELCSSENEVSDRARFIDLYDRLAVDARARQLAGGLPAQRELEESRSALGLAGGGRAGEAESIGSVLRQFAEVHDGGERADMLGEVPT